MSSIRIGNFFRFSFGTQTVACKRPTVVNHYPDQMNPPGEPQLLLLDELVALEHGNRKEATLESFFFVFWLSHFGQVGI